MASESRSAWGGIVVATLIGVGAAALMWPAPADPPVTPAGAPEGPGDPTPPSEAAVTEPAAPAPLTDAEALKGSIKTVSCTSEGAGTRLLSREAMSPTHEAVQAMEGCLDLTAARFEGHFAIELSIVYYLAPEGTVNQTGVGADVNTPEAWDLLQNCAADYWQTYPPTLEPSDEKSFSCVYAWSQNSIAGGVTSVRPAVTRSFAGREARPFGSSVTDTD